MENKKVKVSMSDKTFNTVLMVIATIVLLIVLYPMLIFCLLSRSFSKKVLQWEL